MIRKLVTILYRNVTNAGRDQAPNFLVSYFCYWNLQGIFVFHSFDEFNLRRVERRIVGVAPFSKLTLILVHLLFFRSLGSREGDFETSSWWLGRWNLFSGGDVRSVLWKRTHVRTNHSIGRFFRKWWKGLKGRSAFFNAQVLAFLVQERACVVNLVLHLGGSKMTEKLRFAQNRRAERLQLLRRGQLLSYFSRLLTLDFEQLSLKRL